MTQTEPQPAYHYAVIERALAEIDAGGPGLSLEALAARMSMSPAHFQRVFSQWVGVSPKRWQQYLTLDHARALLAGRHSMIGAAEAVGLSGAGRLHDLFLTWEAMSPGEYARAGQGVRIGWGLHETPFGQALVMATPRGICGIGFVDGADTGAAFADLAARWPRAEYAQDQVTTAQLSQAVFGAGGARRATLHLMGAPFQIKVWEALMAIPEGQVATYSDLARAVGHPTAQRAVGTAVGRNPVSFLIPCHRVLRRDGALGGYHWGLPRKRAMLAWEAARAESLAG